jgi:FAD-dependent urate hydroxylase
MPLQTRDVVGARDAEPTGWCSWQGLATLPYVADKHVALLAIGEHGNLGLWPAGGTDVQWWLTCRGRAPSSDPNARST